MPLFRRGSKEKLNSRNDNERQDNSTFGGQLQTLRENAGLTQRELASRAYTTVGYIKKLESGERNPPRRDFVIDLCLALGLSFDKRNDLLTKAGFAPVNMEDVLNDQTGIFADLLRGNFLTTDEKLTLREQILKIKKRYKKK